MQLRLRPYIEDPELLSMITNITKPSRVRGAGNIQMGRVGIIRSWMVVILVLLLEEWGTRCHGCWEHERTALLQIKSSFSPPPPYDYQPVSGWGIDADCCTWSRISCNATTNRVTELELSYAVDPPYGGWYLNATLFLPFKDLTFLDLSSNQIHGCTENEGFEKLSKLVYLEFLILSENKFNEGILSSLRGLSSLKFLDLSDNKLKGRVDVQGFSFLKRLYLGYNQLKGSINMTELHALSQLETLDLSENEITGFVAAGANKSWSNCSYLGLGGIKGDAMQSLHNFFPNLRILRLTSSNLEGISFGSYDLNNLEGLSLYDTTVDDNFLQIIGALVSLRRLSVRGLNGSQINPGLCKLKQLQELYISGNYHTGTLPPCMANLTSLRELDLSDNQLTGNISLSPLRALKSLEFLDLSDNQFHIPVTLSPFFNHTKLSFLVADGNNIFAETEQHSLTPKFQLNVLSLSGYGYGGRFPKFLYCQHNLNYVNLSHIQLSGGFPYWLLENNTGLTELYLANNSLSGQLRWPSHSNTSLVHLDISENCFRGHVPALIGAYLPILKHLNMSGNGFNGRIPPSIVNMSSMVSLDLSNNGLSGEVPGQLATGCPILRMLMLSNNSLEGHIPNSLFNSSSFIILDLSHNSLYGKLPQWTGNMYALGILDLSDNKISGSLPSNFPSSIEQVYLSKNRLQGPLENAFYNSSNLVMLDLSRNYFSGSIPGWIGTFSNLGFLLLNNNDFEGEIPIQLCKLDKISSIDFSNNYLSGHILPCLRAGTSSENLWIVSSRNNESIFQPYAEITTKKISYFYKGRLLSYFSEINFSCNNLTGEIPPELGRLSTLKMLNLSHNRLIGSIPSTFSNLKEIESLDLSYNNLNGKIPSQLTQLYQLEVFTVAHNNLSGKIPDTAQFLTFDNTSYEDNPLLCGPPLIKSCDAPPSPPPSSQNSGKHDDETVFINMDAFYQSFLPSYSIVLLGLAPVLYIKPHWRRIWFYFVEECINSCYYFIVDNLPMLSKYRAWQPYV